MADKSEPKSLVDFYAGLARTSLRLRTREAIQRGADTAGQQGEQGPRGERGEQGPPGDQGPMPAHEWQGTELRFELALNVWGPWTDLQGPTGPLRMVAGGGGGGPNYGVFGLNMNGIVPAPTAGDTSNFLRGDGTWATPISNSYYPAGW